MSKKLSFGFKSIIPQLLLFGLILFSCNRDDDKGPNYTEEELAILDDQALEKVLQDYYFGLAGKITKYDDIEGNADDAYPNLATYATKLPNGVWIVLHPSVTPSTPYIQPNDSLLVHFQAFSFKSERDSQGNGTYKTLSIPNNRFSSLVGAAVPIWDPFFIHAPMYNTDDLPKYYEIEGIKDALVHFKPTQKEIGDPYFFQGVILVPSRLAYARHKHYTNPTPSTTTAGLSEALRDHNFVFNFEVYKALPRS